MLKTSNFINVITFLHTICYIQELSDEFDRLWKLIKRQTEPIYELATRIPALNEIRSSKKLGNGRCSSRTL
jgi:hypothetical protein